jgi:dimethylamine corrinoid protein
MDGRIPTRYNTLVDAIEQGDAEAAVFEAERLVAANRSLADIYREAMTPCLSEIGDRFSRLEVFLPEMIRSADAVKAIHRALAHTLESDGALEPRATVVIGTSYGDIHDIGKNIVAAMLEVNGFEVIDLGVGVAAPEFIDRARQSDADVIAISSLMSTSMPYLSDVLGLINGNEKDRARFRVIVGGGPVNAEYADRIGADGYADDAAEAVRLIERLLSLSGGTP